MSTNIIQDKYMKFTFGEFESEQFNTYIVRNGEKLSFFNEDNKGVEQFSTSNKNYIYYGGTSYGVKSKEVSMMTICNSRDEFKTIMKYLETGKREFLTFGYEPNWSYDAVITKVSAATFHDDGNSLLVEWKVTFGLYGNGEAFWNAPNYYEFGGEAKIEDTIDNQYGLPLIVENKNMQSGNNKNPETWLYEYYLFSQGNGYNYVKIYQDGIQGEYAAILNNKIYCKYVFDDLVKIRINGRAGTYRSDNGFLEELDENGLNEGMIYFKHDVFECFSPSPNTTMLQNYEGCLLINSYWEKQIMIEYILPWGITEFIYASSNTRSLGSYTIVSPVKLELTHPLREGDWISIEKHNNF